MKKQGQVRKLMLGRETTTRMTAQMLSDSALRHVAGGSLQPSLSTGTDTTPLCG